MASFGDVAVEQSKFEKFGGHITSFLREEIDSYKNGTSRKSTLYEHQIKAVLAVEKYFVEGNRADPALIVAPTGAGKSGIICLLPYVLKSSKAFILSPSVKITDQLEEDFGLMNKQVKLSFMHQAKVVRECDLNMVLEQGEVVRKTQVATNMKWSNLVIVNAQKFGSNSGSRLRHSNLENLDDEEQTDVTQTIEIIKENFSNFSTLIVDEAHHYPADTWDLIRDKFKDKQVIFLTATPYRGKCMEPLRSAKPLQNDGIKVTYHIDMQHLINLHILRPLNYTELQIDLHDDLWNDEFTKEQLNSIERQILNKLDEHDMIDSNIKHKAMILMPRNKTMVENVSKAMQSSTYYISDNRSERSLRNFEVGERRILFVCGRLLEGYNNPEISICVILRKVAVIGLFTQFVGRCIRTTKQDGSDNVRAELMSLSMYKQELKYEQYKSLNKLN